MSRDDEQADYIVRFQRHCDRYLSKLADPAGKSVLVLGCGHGTEMLWSIRHGASEVVGVDVGPRSTGPLELAMSRYKLGARPRPWRRRQPIPRYEILQMGAEDVESLRRQFDLVVSNNVFEHLPDVTAALGAARGVVRPGTGRIAIFTDPLFYSSHGSHLPVQPWEHLWSSQDRIEAQAPDAHSWRQYSTLNKMTLRDFVAAVEATNLVVLTLETVVDRSLKQLPRFLNSIDPGISVTNLAVEGIAALLKCLEQ